MKTFALAMGTGLALIVALCPLMSAESAAAIAGTVATAIMVLANAK